MTDEQWQKALAAHRRNQRWEAAYPWVVFALIVVATVALFGPVLWWLR